MKVVWVGIYDRGNASNERVHFKALADVNLSFYAIFDTRALAPNKIEANQKSCYWFAPKQVKAGENIVLYTRPGIENSEQRKDGSVFHFFFRGVVGPLYSQPDRRAVIFELNNWNTTPTE